MRWRTAVAISIGSCALGATLVACFDLFHSTGDILTACQIDSGATGCQLCAPSPLEARQRAEHACAWLGACETPFGRNGFGSCMIQALMAYDCAANPNHRFKGKAAGLWGCLGATRSCTDVHSCVFPAGREACASSGEISCGSATISTANNDDVRIECAGGVAAGENCALWGQTCASSSSGAVCSGSKPGGCSMGSGCYDPATAIHWCTDAGDVGIDCASFGIQRCSGFPEVDAPSHQWVACVADDGVDAGTTTRCAPDASATCVDGVSVSCSSGVVESLDCAALLGSHSACAAGPLVPPFDWTAACVMSPPTCLADSCDGGTLSGCERGAAFSMDCSGAGLGRCATIVTDDGQRAACAPPP